VKLAAEGGATRDLSVYSLSSGASSVGAGVQGGGVSPLGEGDDDEEGVGDLEGRRPGGEGAERMGGRGQQGEDGRDRTGGGDGRYRGNGGGGRRGGEGIEREGSLGSFTSPGSAARICSSTNIMAMSSPPPSATQHMPPRRTESDAGPIWI
jgi:hypothetical protein